MTVGIAAIAERNTNNPKIVLSSDRLITTQQQSAIEHEHPDTKIKVFGDDLQNSNLAGIVAGSVGLGETLKNRIDANLYAYCDQNGEEPWVDTSADIASNVYRGIVQEKIENLVLSDYGLELDDLSKQHQFKDEFLNNILSEVSQVKQSIQQNMTLLFAGVGQHGHGVFQISNGDSMPRNDMGYCSIGSGSQPAESEFIKSDYKQSSEISDVLATMAAGHHSAKNASGVGGDPDFVVVDLESVSEIDERAVGELMKRQARIAEEQNSVREQILSEEGIQWETDQ